MKSRRYLSENFETGKFPELEGGELNIIKKK